MRIDFLKQIAQHSEFGDVEKLRPVREVDECL
jgi:hypothetical protein